MIKNPSTILPVYHDGPGPPFFLFSGIATHDASFLRLVAAQDMAEMVSQSMETSAPAPATSGGSVNGSSAPAVVLSEPPPPPAPKAAPAPPVTRMSFGKAGPAPPVTRMSFGVQFVALRRMSDDGDEMPGGEESPSVAARDVAVSGVGGLAKRGSASSTAVVNEEPSDTSKPQQPQQALLKRALLRSPAAAAEGGGMRRRRVTCAPHPTAQALARPARLSPSLSLHSVPKSLFLPRPPLFSQRGPKGHPGAFPRGGSGARSRRVPVQRLHSGKLVLVRELLPNLP